MTQLPFDTTETLAGATIQHGFYNNRIYMMKLGEVDPAEVARAVLAKARQAGYAKVFAKLPQERAAEFLKLGFRQEARVPGFYHGDEAAVFLCAYLDPARRREASGEELDEILQLALSRQSPASALPPDLQRPLALRPCREEDIDQMADIYRRVFPTYPFPIHDPDYLLQTMRTHVDYFGITAGDQLVALSSAEMDRNSGNVEMTDFATLPDWLGNGLAVHLLWHMEEAMRRLSIPTAYTIARAASPGMNITFAKMGYQYGGRLINNTNISGRIESMNIWHKPLVESTDTP